MNTIELRLSRHGDLLKETFDKHGALRWQHIDLNDYEIQGEQWELHQKKCWLEDFSDTHMISTSLASFAKDLVDFRDELTAVKAVCSAKGVEICVYVY
jgi:hypothetical protein